MRVAEAHVGLRPVGPEDYGLLMAMETDPSVAHRWRYQGRSPSPSQYVQSLWGGVLDQSIVVRRGDGEAIGLVTTYDANLRNQTAWIAVLSRGADRGNGLALAGLALQLTCLFTEWPFRRVFAEAHDLNTAAYASAIGRVCTIEGRYRADSLIDGEYRDRLVLAFDRDVWMQEIGAFLLRRLVPIELGA